MALCIPSAPTAPTAETVAAIELLIQTAIDAAHAAGRDWMQVQFATPLDTQIGVRLLKEAAPAWALHADGACGLMVYFQADRGFGDPL